MNPDAVNNSGISKASLQTDANNKLDLMSLESTQLNVSSNVNSIKFNTSDTAINTLSIGNDTSNIDSKITSGNDNTLSDAQQVLLYGRTSGGGGGNNLHSVLVSGSGHLVCDVDNFPNGQETMTNSIPVVLASNHYDINTKVNSVLNLGGFQNMANDITLAPAGESSIIDISNYRKGSLFYTDTSNTTSDTLNLLVSPNGVNYFKHTQICPFESTPGVRDSTNINLSFEGLTHAKLINNSTTDTYNNVKCTLVGSP